jgi:hypothetical protein
MSAAESPGECRAKRNPAVLITLAGLTDGVSIGFMVTVYHSQRTHRQIVGGFLFARRLQHHSLNAANRKTHRLHKFV